MRQIFEAKNRPSDNPLIVHVSSIDMLKTFVEEITPTVSNRIIAEIYFVPHLVLYDG